MNDVLSTALDIFRLRQYFNVITRTREVWQGIRDDAGFLEDVRRALLPLPLDPHRSRSTSPFGRASRFEVSGLSGRRVALIATGGSGALASVVGAARAFEEAGLAPSVISLCSGSALFGFPIAAGVPAEDVAEFCIELEPSDYVDLNLEGLRSLVFSAGRGFAGLIRGERLEATYRRLLGGRTLGDMPIPAYAPIWNIESNRTEYVGPRTHPEMPIARAVHMAVALPLFIQPAELEGLYWCDGGIVDIFPVRPVLDIEPPSDAAVAINGFYPPQFDGEDATDWQKRSWSILHVASQVRTCQQVELARTNLARLERTMPTAIIQPVSYDKVRGVGFYRQFLSTRDWPHFMASGRLDARHALRHLGEMMERPAHATAARHK
jgi:NTE family protein